MKLKQQIVKRKITENDRILKWCANRENCINSCWLRGHITLWKQNRPHPKNRSAVNQSIPNTTGTDSKSDTHSKAHSSGAQAITNCAYGARYTTQFPVEYQQICGCQLNNNFHSKQSQDFWWQHKNFQHQWAHTLRVEIPSNRHVANPPTAAKQHKSQKHARY